MSTALALAILSALLMLCIISNRIVSHHNQKKINTLQEELCRISTLTLYRTDVMKRVLELAPATETYFDQAEREVREERGMPR